MPACEHVQQSQLTQSPAMSLHSSQRWLYIAACVGDKQHHHPPLSAHTRRCSSPSSPRRTGLRGWRCSGRRPRGQSSSPRPRPTWSARWRTGWTLATTSCCECGAEGGWHPGAAGSCRRCTSCRALGKTSLHFTAAAHVEHGASLLPTPAPTSPPQVRFCGQRAGAGRHGADVSALPQGGLQLLSRPRSLTTTNTRVHYEALTQPVLRSALHFLDDE